MLLLADDLSHSNSRYHDEGQPVGDDPSRRPVGPLGAHLRVMGVSLIAPRLEASGDGRADRISRVSAFVVYYLRDCRRAGGARAAVVYAVESGKLSLSAAAVTAK